MYDSAMAHADGSKNIRPDYVDLSDYGRGLALWIARPLAATNIRAWHITIVHFIVMLVAAWFLSRGTLEGYTWSGLLLMVKNILDAADGSLARLQDRPSRVGRFLDSNLDFVGNLVYFLAIPGVPLAASLFGFLSFTFQGTVFNYHAVRYRQEKGGDTTSKVREDPGSPYPYDSPRAVQMLYQWYRWMYGWQDALIRRVDRMLAPDGRLAPPRLMELFSVLGPGFQYVFMMLLLILGIPQLMPDMFIYVFNIYMVCIMLVRAECGNRIQSA